MRVELRSAQRAASLAAASADAQAAGAKLHPFDTQANESLNEILYSFSIHLYFLLRFVITARIAARKLGAPRSFLALVRHFASRVASSQPMNCQAHNMQS